MIRHRVPHVSAVYLALFAWIILLVTSSSLTPNNTNTTMDPDVDTNVTIPQYGTFIPGSANWVSDTPTANHSTAQSLGWGTYSVGQTYGVYSYMDQYGESTQGGDGPSGGHTQASQGGPSNHGHYGAGHGY